MKFYPSDIFYTKFSSSYSSYFGTKREYIEAVNSFIMSEASSPISVIDVGAGDGRRSRDVCDLLGAKALTLIDNSDGMIAHLKKIEKSYVIKADISDPSFEIGQKYDVMLCLWNVIGHMLTQEQRLSALKNMRKLLADSGVIFIDVNNRYNLSHYGVKAVIRNMWTDVFSRQNDQLGIFDLSINTADDQLRTKVYISNPFEIRKLFRMSGLKVIKVRRFNYRTGKKAMTIFGGQSVYKVTKK
jgi:SAM-dependent methyltransferase